MARRKRKKSIYGIRSWIYRSFRHSLENYNDYRGFMPHADAGTAIYGHPFINWIKAVEVAIHGFVDLIRILGNCGVRKDGTVCPSGSAV